MKPCHVVVILVFRLLSCTSWSFSTTSRRAMIRRAAAATVTTSFSAATLTSSTPSLAATTTSPRDSIQQAQTTLTTLLDNWQRATVDCTFADVPRDLLETKNKELLLEKAKTSALFDKSASVETCKTTNRIVRDYLGVTGKGPLVKMEKQLKLAMDHDVDVNRLEEYIAEMENFQYSMNQADSLSYLSQTQDFDANNNFQKDDTNRKQDSALEQSRKAIVDARNSLQRMAGMLVVEPSS